MSRQTSEGPRYRRFRDDAIATKSVVAVVNAAKKASGATAGRSEG
jgi:hypothetical protein